MYRNIALALTLLLTMGLSSCFKPPSKAELLKQISPIHGQIDEPLPPETLNEIIEKTIQFEVTPVTKEEIGIIETNLGTIKFEFFPEVAPNHCSNFKRLANSGYYNGTTFHRVIPGFMIQGGDILTRDNDRSNDGLGGPGYTINAEFNSIPHEPGILSMARPQDINGAGSQFFICVARAPHLDRKYTVFGKVSAGMEVVNKIVTVDRDPNTDNPLQRVVMKRVYVINKKNDF